MTLSPLAQALVDISDISHDFQSIYGDTDVTEADVKEKLTNCYIRTIVEPGKTEGEASRVRLSIVQHSGMNWIPGLISRMAHGDSYIITEEKGDNQTSISKKLIELKEIIDKANDSELIGAIHELKTRNIAIASFTNLYTCVQKINILLKRIGTRKGKPEEVFFNTFKIKDTVFALPNPLTFINNENKKVPLTQYPTPVAAENELDNINKTLPKEQAIGTYAISQGKSPNDKILHVIKKNQATSQYKFTIHPHTHAMTLTIDEKPYGPLTNIDDCLAITALENPGTYYKTKNDLYCFVDQKNQISSASNYESMVRIYKDSQEKVGEQIAQEVPIAETQFTLAEIPKFSSTNEKNIQIENIQKGAINKINGCKYFKKEIHSENEALKLIQKERTPFIFKNEDDKTLSIAYWENNNHKVRPLNIYKNESKCYLNIEGEDKELFSLEQIDSLNTDLKNNLNILNLNFNPLTVLVNGESVELRRDKILKDAKSELNRIQKLLPADQVIGTYAVSLPKDAQAGYLSVLINADTPVDYQLSIDPETQLLTLKIGEVEYPNLKTIDDCLTEITKHSLKDKPAGTFYLIENKIYIGNENKIDEYDYDATTNDSPEEFLKTKNITDSKKIDPPKFSSIEEKKTIKVKVEPGKKTMYAMRGAEEGLADLASQEASEFSIKMTSIPSREEVTKQLDQIIQTSKDAQHPERAQGTWAISKSRIKNILEFHYIDNNSLPSTISFKENPEEPGAYLFTSSDGKQYISTNFDDLLVELNNELIENNIKKSLSGEKSGTYDTAKIGGKEKLFFVSENNEIKVSDISIVKEKKPLFSIDESEYLSIEDLIANRDSDYKPVKATNITLNTDKIYQAIQNEKPGTFFTVDINQNSTIYFIDSEKKLQSREYISLPNGNFSYNNNEFTSLGDIIKYIDSDLLAPSRLLKSGTVYDSGRTWSNFDKAIVEVLDKIELDGTYIALHTDKDELFISNSKERGVTGYTYGVEKIEYKDDTKISTNYVIEEKPYSDYPSFLDKIHNVTAKKIDEVEAEKIDATVKAQKIEKDEAKKLKIESPEKRIGIKSKGVDFCPVEDKQKQIEKIQQLQQFCYPCSDEEWISLAQYFEFEGSKTYPYLLRDTKQEKGDYTLLSGIRPLELPPYFLPGNANDISITKDLNFQHAKGRLFSGRGEENHPLGLLAPCWSFNDFIYDAIAKAESKCNTTEQATTALNSTPRNCFLLWQEANDPKQLHVSARTESGVKHYNVERREGKIILKNEQDEIEVTRELFAFLKEKFKISYKAAKTKERLNAVVEEKGETDKKEIAKIYDFATTNDFKPQSNVPYRILSKEGEKITLRELNKVNNILTTTDYEILPLDNGEIEMKHTEKEALTKEMFESKLKNMPTYKQYIYNKTTKLNPIKIMERNVPDYIKSHMPGFIKNKIWNEDVDYYDIKNIDNKEYLTTYKVTNEKGKDILISKKNEVVRYDDKVELREDITERKSIGVFASHIENMNSVKELLLLDEADKAKRKVINENIGILIGQSSKYFKSTPEEAEDEVRSYSQILGTNVANHCVISQLGDSISITYKNRDNIIEKIDIQINESNEITVKDIKYKITGTVLSEILQDQKLKPISECKDLKETREKLLKNLEKISQQQSVVKQDFISYSSDLKSLNKSAYAICSDSTSGITQFYLVYTDKKTGTIKDDPIPLDTTTPETINKLTEAINNLVEATPEELERVILKPYYTKEIQSATPYREILNHNPGVNRIRDSLPVRNIGQVEAKTKLETVLNFFGPGRIDNSWVIRPAIPPQKPDNNQYILSIAKKDREATVISEELIIIDRTTGKFYLPNRKEEKNDFDSIDQIVNALGATYANSLSDLEAKKTVSERQENKLKPHIIEKSDFQKIKDSLPKEKTSPAWYGLYRETEGIYTLEVFKNGEFTIEKGIDTRKLEEKGIDEIIGKFKGIDSIELAKEKLENVKETARQKEILANKNMELIAIEKDETIDPATNKKNLTSLIKLNDEIKELKLLLNTNEYKEVENKVIKLKNLLDPAKTTPLDDALVQQLKVQVGYVDTPVKLENTLKDIPREKQSTTTNRYAFTYADGKSKFITYDENNKRTDWIVSKTEAGKIKLTDGTNTEIYDSIEKLTNKKCTGKSLLKELLPKPQPTTPMSARKVTSTTTLQPEPTAPVMQQTLQRVENEIKSKIEKYPNNDVKDLIIELKQEASANTTSLEKKNLLDKIILRYNQMSDSAISKLHGLTPKEQLKISWLLEIQIPKINDTSLSYFGKKDFGIERTVFIENKEIYIKALGSIDKGSSKKITTATRFPIDSNSKTVQRVAVSKSGKLSGEKTEEELEEMRTYVKLNNNPGIWPLHHYFQYTTKKKNIERISSVMELADGNLEKIPKESLTLENELEIIDGLISGVATMHNKGFVHEDLKQKNALFKRDENGKYKVGWTDFGWTSNPREGEDSLLWKKGGYGTYTHTAPELLGNTKFAKEGGFGVDVWALGVICYQVHFKKDPPWLDLLEDKSSKQPQTRAIKSLPDTVKAMINKEITKMREELSTKDSSSTEAQIESLICQMLDPDARKRSNINALSGQFEKIKKGVGDLSSQKLPEAKKPSVATLQAQPPQQGRLRDLVSKSMLSGTNEERRAKYLVDNHPNILKEILSAEQTDDTKNACKLFLGKIVGKSSEWNPTSSEKETFLGGPFKNWAEQERKTFLKLMNQAGLLTKALQGTYRALLT